MDRIAVVLKNPDEVFRGFLLVHDQLGVKVCKNIDGTVAVFFPTHRIERIDYEGKTHR